MRIGKTLLEKSFPTTCGELTFARMIEGDLPTVFISYPKDFTSVCTRQLCDYRDAWENLAELRCRWWGINRTALETHRRFKQEKRLPFELVTDSAGDLLGALGLKGLLWTKRGFAVLSPDGELLATLSVSPLSFPGAEEAKKLLEPLLGHSA